MSALARELAELLTKHGSAAVFGALADAAEGCASHVTSGAAEMGFEDAAALVRRAALGVKTGEREGITLAEISMLLSVTTPSAITAPDAPECACGCGRPATDDDGRLCLQCYTEALAAEEVSS